MICKTQPMPTKSLQSPKRRPSQLGTCQKPPGSVRWLAGVRTSAMIHYACVGSTESKPGWTPYAAMAERYPKAQAKRVATASVKAFKLPDGVPCVQLEDKAFKGAGTECELLN